MTKRTKVILAIVGGFFVLGAIGALTAPKDQPEAEAETGSPTSSPLVSPKASPAPHSSSPTPATVEVPGGFSLDGTTGEILSVVSKQDGAFYGRVHTGDIPADCSLTALYVARWVKETKSYVATSVVPEDLVGDPGTSVMFSFTPQVNGWYAFRSNMDLKPDFWGKAIVVRVECEV